MLSPCTQAWPTCHQGLLRIPAQLRRTALSSSPCMCPSQYQALTWTKPNSFPPQTPPCSCNSPHSLRTQRIAPQISREERVPSWAHAAWNPRTISRGYCRGRTASLLQTIKDKQSKRFKSPLGALWVEVARLRFQMAPYIQDRTRLDAPHFWPVWRDTVGEF